MKIVAQKYSLDDIVEQIVDQKVERRMALARTASRWMRATDSPLGRRCISRLVADRVLEGAKPSKHLLVDREQHDAWIAAHPVTNKPAAVTATDDDLAAAFGVERGRAA